MQQSQKGKSEAVGSVWNPNSWHWEQKNYNEKVKKIIEDKVSSISLSEPNAKVTMTKVNAKGEAELMIRKGKQSVIYDFEVEVEFRGENSENEVEGSFKIVDINQSDMDFELVDIKINKTDYNMLAHASKELVRKTLRARLEEHFVSLVKEIQQFEADKLESKKNERELQNQEIQRLQSQNKELQDQMLKDQKEKEYQQKIANNNPK